MKSKVFLKAAAELDAAGVFWWLSDGSALGCHRDGQFIASDGDIDLGVWIESIPLVAKALTGEDTRTRGHQVWRVSDEIKIDVHGHERAGDTVFFRLGTRSELRYEFPAHLFEDFEFGTLYGRSVLLPSPIEEYLTAHYGDWQTPTSKWKWNSSPPCLRR